MDAQYDFEDSAWDDVSDMAKELIMKLIVDDPQERMTLDDFLASDWITVLIAKRDKRNKRKQTKQTKQPERNVLYLCLTFSKLTNTNL